MSLLLVNLTICIFLVLTEQPFGSELPIHPRARILVRDIFAGATMQSHCLSDPRYWQYFVFYFPDCF